MLSLSPNIVTSENSILKVDVLEKKEITVAITDFSGRVIKQQQVIVQPGAYTIILLTGKLASGAYLVTVFTEGEKPQSVKLIKQ